MSQSKIHVTLSAADYRAYVVAARALAKILGRKRAPTALALIEFNLSNRDAVGISDDYLDGIAWLAGPDQAALAQCVRLAARQRADRGCSGIEARARTLVRLRTPRIACGEK